MVLAIIFLELAIAAYSYKELHAHGKLRWMSKDEYGFWGEKSWFRKYKLTLMLGFHKDAYTPRPAPETWYYKLAGLKYEERFPLSGTLLVWVTDAPHFLQFLMFNFLSISIVLAIGFSWKLLALVWLLVHLCHFGVYRLLQK